MNSRKMLYELKQRSISADLSASLPASLSDDAVKHSFIKVWINTISPSYEWAPNRQLQLWLPENLGPHLPDLLIFQENPEIRFLCESLNNFSVGN